jgi:hypothetical protein
MTEMSSNIIEFVNLAKPKKPRGKKAQKVQKTPKVNRIINKRNPFRFFKNLDISVMRDEIDSFVEKFGWITDKNPDRYTELNEWDRAVISMFTSLKTGIPAILVQDFFISFDEDPSNNIVQFFINYKRRPEVQVHIMDMKELLRRRKAKPNSKRKIKEVFIVPKTYQVLSFCLGVLILLQNFKFFSNKVNIFAFSNEEHNT